VPSITVTRNPFIVVVSGPSGVGKSTVVDRVLERATNFIHSVSITTRPPRGGERDGVDYYFVTPDEFAKRRDAGELLEWAEVHGRLYGTPAAFVEKQLLRGVSVVLEIDVQGGMNIKDRNPDAVLIFLLPPSYSVLRERLALRGTDDEETVERRLENARKEITYFRRYDYLIVNDDLARCVDDVLAVIRAESLRRERSAIE
jgi:guanylate kinase